MTSHFDVSENTMDDRPKNGGGGLRRLLVWLLLIAIFLRYVCIWADTFAGWNRLDREDASPVNR